MKDAPQTHTTTPAGRAKSLPSGWTRPTPVRHDDNFRAWMLFLAGVCLVIASWIPIRTAWQRARFKPYLIPQREADSFIVLAYGGISAGQQPGPGEISRYTFEAHIRMLRERGFNPIGLQDIVDFYQKGKLLPSKAVLITMEQSRKSSYLETRRTLQEYRWKAVMFVRSDTIAHRDPDVLRWPILRDMQRSGTWDIGAQSIHGFIRIPAGPTGETGNFFSSPKWLGTKSRLETPNEFYARIKEEHRRTVVEFKEQTGTAPIAFAFPYGDYGQYDIRARATRVMNLAAIGNFYSIGFSSGPFMLNTRHSNPHALNRMQVSPDWTIQDFISIIEASQAVQPSVITNALSPSRWQTVWGITETTDDVPLLLRAVTEQDQAAGPPSTGGLTWLLGSDVFQDFSVRLRFRLRAGQFVVRFRYRPGEDEGIRFLIDPFGSRRLLQKTRETDELLLAIQQGYGISSGKIHELKITVRERTVMLKIDGEMVLAEPIELTTPPAPGMFGLEVWDPIPGKASVEILELEFPKQHYTLLSWEPEAEDKIPVLLAQLHNNAARYAAISPPWMDVKRAVPLVLPQHDNKTLDVFARIHGIPIMPRITIHKTELALALPPQKTVTEAHRMGADGIYLDCRHIPIPEIPELTPWLQSFYEKTKEHQMKLALTLPDAVKRTAAFASIAGLFPSAWVTATSPALAEQLADTIPEIIVAEEFSDPAIDMHLLLYHQLAIRDLPEEILSEQKQKDTWRQDGLLAYHEGQYENAIEHWHRWLADDPRSTDALGLIGMAYIKAEKPLEALKYYTRSLEIAPGQISMAIRRAELLDTLDRVDEAREQLNLYARIFPGHPDILIAQSKWLQRRNRQTEAKTILETLVQQHPFNIDARIALLNLQTDSAERHKTMRDVLALGQSTDAWLPFGNMLLSHELLTYPESGVFFEHIRNMTRDKSNRPVHHLYERFLPLSNKVIDDFAQGRISDEWIASAGIRAIERGSYELRTAVDQAEAYLRLQRSELMRDGYLEVVLDETQGFFWIYARRSARSMVRFGFDDTGFIHIQAWYNGELLAQQSRPWMRPPGSLNVRLEIRGDGARGFINNMNVFSTPLEIPQHIAYGWWGIAPFAFEMGMARARIIQMICEPIESAIVMTVPAHPQSQIEQLLPYTGRFSALAPAWFFQNPDGTLPTALPKDANITRMFCAFHGIRLLPVVDLVYNAQVPPQHIIDLIQTNNLTGVIIKRRTRPSTEWLTAMHTSLESHPATVIILQTEAALWHAPTDDTNTRDRHAARPEVRDQLLPAADDPLFLQEIPVSGVLLPPTQNLWTITITQPDDEPAEDLARIHPRLHLLGPNGWIHREDLPKRANSKKD